jgi:hypothetical protein
MSEWFDDVAEGIDPAERERLRGVHELLVEAGPPPELPESLATLPEGVTDGQAVVVPLASRRRRRVGVGLLLAAALTVVAFGGGFLVGHHGGGSSPEAVRSVTMGGSGATAALQVGAPDSGGNWPVSFTVSGLPAQKAKYAYYEIFVLRHGKPGYPCAGFRVNGSSTKVTFTVPYEVTRSTQWVVTKVNRANHWPGAVVMT